MSELNDFRQELPDIKRALILAPHPDDETLGCGGTIATYAGRITFTMLVLSDGEAINLQEANRAELRKRELEDAMKILGISDIIFLNIPDGKFQQHRNVIRERLSEIFSLKKPDMVFSPSPVDLHTDHTTTAMVCIELMERFPQTGIAFYEIYSPIRFNTLIDISRVIDTKKEALQKYHYSMLKKSDIFVSSNLSLNRARSLFTLKDSYYEAFWIPDKSKNMADIIEWFSPAIAPPSPEDRLLNNLRITDSLIHQMRTVESEVIKKDLEIRERDGVIQNLTSELGNRENAIYELTHNLTLIEGSIFWRLARKFHQLRDALLPVRTKRRRIYDRLVSILKKT